MGGWGLGHRLRWDREGRKTLTADCLRLDALAWQKQGILAAGLHLLITCQWTFDYGTFWLPVEVWTLNLASAVVRLGDLTDSQPSLAAGMPGYSVWLRVTNQKVGGARWWWSCPRCERRCRHLYRPPPFAPWACRACHRLAYSSSRESRRTTQWERRLRSRLSGGDLY